MSEHNKQPWVILKNLLMFVSFAVFFCMIVCWVFNFYPFNTLLDSSGKPVGNDFPQFYIAGGEVLNNPLQIYQKNFQLYRLKEILPNLKPEFYLPFWYPPLLALLFYPLSFLSYLNALAVFSLFSVLCLYLSVRFLSALKPAEASFLSDQNIFFALLAFPPTLECLLTGQLSTIGLLLSAAAVCLMLKAKTCLAGFVLGLSFYKPNILILFICACVILRAKVLFGFLLSLTCLYLLSCLILPGDWFAGYLSALADLWANQQFTGTPMFKRMGLINLIQAESSQSIKAALICCGFITVSFLAVKIRKNFGKDRAFDGLALASFLSLNAIFNPYLPVYDLCIIFLSVFLSVFFLVHQDKNPALALSPDFFKLLLILFFLGPYISQILALESFVQVYPLFLLWLASWQIYNLLKQGKIRAEKNPQAHA